MQGQSIHRPREFHRSFDIVLIKTAVNSTVSLARLNSVEYFLELKVARSLQDECAERRILALHLSIMAR